MSYTSYQMVPLDRIFAKLRREVNLEGVNESDIIEWVGEALAGIGTTALHEEAVCFIEVNNHQAQIPAGFKAVIQIAKNNTFVKEEATSTGLCATDVLTDDTVTANPADTPPATCPVVIDCNGSPITDYELAYYRPFFDLGLGYYGWTGSNTYRTKFSPIRLANSALYNSIACQEEDMGIYTGIEDNYTIIAGETIRTSFLNGQIAMSYLRVQLDSESGYPLVPDNYEHLEAITNYIIFKIFKKEFYSGREGAERRMLKAEDDWQKYCGRAGNYDILPKGVDQLENIRNMRQYLMPNMNEYSNFFGRLGRPERRDYNNPYGTGKGYNYFRGI